jgi:hypothetical protein
MAARISFAVHQIRAHIDYLHQYDYLSRADLKRVDAPQFARAFARTILQGQKPRLAGHEFSLASIRRLSGKPAKAILVVNRRLEPRSKLRAFVGHRFLPAITSGLRHNLLVILKEYRIHPDYADSDMPNGQIFQTIVRRIRESDFCIFDDRETETRPNVFIELGAAIALKRPYFHLSYVNRRTVRSGRRLEKLEIPSDLAGLLRLEYSTNEELFQQFAMRLPAFLKDRRLGHQRDRQRRR